MTQADLEAIMTEYPKLTNNGFFCPPRDFLKPEDYEKYRERLRNSDINVLNQVEALLVRVRKTKRVARRSEAHSYCLKHRLEKHVYGRYISNGQAILVAIVLGFHFTVSGPNASFNMNIKDIHAIDEMEHLKCA